MEDKELFQPLIDVYKDLSREQLKIAFAMIYLASTEKNINNKDVLQFLKLVPLLHRADGTPIEENFQDDKIDELYSKTKG
jgi:hypothetical protein